jgi:hypothetical protein
MEFDALSALKAMALDVLSALKNTALDEFISKLIRSRNTCDVN